MSPPDDSPDDGDSNREDDRPGFVETLVDLLREVADDDGRPRTRSGTGRIGGANVDFSVSAGSLSDRPGGPPRTGPHDAPRGSRDDSADDGSSPYVTTRETPEGRLVVADLEGVDREDLATRLDDEAGDLVIVGGGETVGRVPLEDPDLEVVDATLNNDVLEVRLAREH